MALTSEKWLELMTTYLQGLMEEVCGTVIPTWNTVSLGEHWADGTQTPAYCKTSDGFVHLRGQVTGNPSYEVFTLPTGYRPAVETYLPVLAGTSTGILKITTDGIVTLDAGDTSWVCLDSLSFSVIA